jgi:hypothetical protein
VGIDPEERAWQETQRRKLETGEWAYPGSSNRESSTLPPNPEPQAATAPSSIEDVMAAQAAVKDADAQSLMRQILQTDGTALNAWKGSVWTVRTVPAFYRPIVADFLERAAPDHWQSGWVLTDDVSNGPSVKITGLLPREWVTGARFEWWDVAGRRRNRQCVSLLDERGERVRFVRVQLEENTSGDSRQRTYDFIAFFDDGVRCASNVNTDYRLKTPDTVTTHIARHLAEASASGGGRRRRH